MIRANQFYIIKPFGQLVYVCGFDSNNNIVMQSFPGPGVAYAHGTIPSDLDWAMRKATQKDIKAGLSMSLKDNLIQDRVDKYQAKLSKIL